MQIVRLQPVEDISTFLYYGELYRIFGDGGDDYDDMGSGSDIMMNSTEDMNPPSSGDGQNPMQRKKRQTDSDESDEDSDEDSGEDNDDDDDDDDMDDEVQQFFNLLHSDPRAALNLYFRYGQDVTFDGLFGVLNVVVRYFDDEPRTAVFDALEEVYQNSTYQFFFELFYDGPLEFGRYGDLCP